MGVLMMAEPESLLERLGRKQVQLEDTVGNLQKVSLDFLRTLALLRRIQAGEVAIADVTVTDTGWSIASPGPEGGLTEDREVIERDDAPEPLAFPRAVVSSGEPV